MKIINKKYIAPAMIGLSVLGCTGGLSFANDTDVNLNNNGVVSYNESINTKATSVGQNYRFSAIGKTFNAHNEATKIGSEVRGFTEMTASSNVSKGKMAVTTSVFNSSGQLLYGTYWKYNSTATTYVGVGTKAFPSSSRYYIGGYARVIDSSGKYIDKKLPDTTSPKINISPELEKERNKLYQDYKMIPALATNGESGYIYESDLLGEAPKSPEEAIAIQESRQSGDFKSIPVYAKDTRTVVGELRIGE